jgi:hypothetical protein
LNVSKTKERTITVEISGHSDDCIEVVGDRLTDEFSAYTGPKFLHFSDGSIFQAEYSPDDSGCWRINRIKEGTAKATKTHVGVPDGADEEDDDYSDRWTLKGDLQWVECWNSPEPSHDTLSDMFREGIEVGDRVDNAALLKAYRLVVGHTS